MSQYLLKCMVLILIFSYGQAQVPPPPPCHRPAFNCIANDPTYIETLGGRFKCPEGSYCDFEKNDVDCAMCVKKQDCINYECSIDATWFTIQGSSPLLCPRYFTCTNTPPCNMPCKPIKCENPPKFSCLNATTAVWNPNNNPAYCLENMICNKNNVYPCDLCIKDPNKLNILAFPKLEYLE